MGYQGGHNGGLGEFTLSDGTHPHPKSQYRLSPDKKVVLRLPGGGGFYPPQERDPELVRQDVLNGYVSPEAARTQYSVALGEGDEIDWKQTQRLRAEKHA